MRLRYLQVSWYTCKRRRQLKLKIRWGHVFFQLSWLTWKKMAAEEPAAQQEHPYKMAATEVTVQLSEYSTVFP